MRLPYCFLLLFFGASLCSAQHRLPSSYTPERSYTGQTLDDLLTTPERHVDIGLWALIVAHTYDPSVDVEAGLGDLDAMALEVQKMLAGRTSDLDKMLAIKTFLYEPGPWNQYHPFDYDLDDPLGTKPENQLLPTYLRTRKGNCVSMPTLFLALMERIDPDVPLFGVPVPMHLFVRLHDRQTGDVWNVETTNGGHPARNRWYIDRMKIPDQAIESGAYLRDLTKRAFLAELIGVLTRRARRNERYDEALRYAEMMLTLHPLSINGWIHKGAVLEWIVYEAVGEEPGNLPLEQQAHYLSLSAESRASIAKAQSLGWIPATDEDRDAYLEQVQAERNRREQMGR